MFYFAKFHLWSIRIGQSSSVYKHQTKRRLRRRCWLSKVYFQCEIAYFRKKNFEIYISKLISNVKGVLEVTNATGVACLSVSVCCVLGQP